MPTAILASMLLALITVVEMTGSTVQSVVMTSDVSHFASVKNLLVVPQGGLLHGCLGYPTVKKAVDIGGKGITRVQNGLLRPTC